MAEPRPPSILLVEDSEPTARALRVLFHQRANHDVYWAATIAEAVGMLIKRPDAVLLDLMLPDGDGEDVIERIRDLSPASRIVVVTALPEGCARIVRVSALKPDAIVHKPYDVPTLIAAVSGEPRNDPGPHPLTQGPLP